MTTSLIALVLGCSGTTEPGSTDTDTDIDITTPTGDLPLVGTDVLQFRGKVPKNLLFLSIDTFRKDHHNAHGDLGLTPFLGEVARDGVVLNNHMQCSNWTFASTTCTLAGRYSTERGHMPRLSGVDEQKPKVPQGTEFLATWLGQAGFFSLIVSGNAWLSGTWGNTQGYDEEYTPEGLALAVVETGTDNLTDAILRGAVPERWFMHLHFMEPHASYDPPSEYLVGIDQLEPWPEDLTERPTHYDWRGQWPSLDPADQDLLEQHLRVMYEGEVRVLDDRMAINWSTLESAGMLDDTLVVIWNDHGEQFWEHGDQTHAYSLFGEENDGFAVFWAKNIVANSWDGPTTSIDLAPTLLDLYGLPIPDEVTGIPVGQAPPDRPRFGEAVARLGATQSIVRDNKKLIFYWSGAVAYFDRNTDPDELVNLYDPTDPTVLELWADLKPMIELMVPTILGGSPVVNWPPDLP